MGKATLSKVMKRLSKLGISAYPRENYSGKFMYGRSTSALVIPDACNAYEAEQEIAELRKANKDGMGCGVVYY